MHRPARRIPLVLAPPLLLALGFAAGFAWFVRDADRPAAPPPHADGIVVLTGGAGRVEAALRLLAQGRGEKLLVSGVGRAAEFTEFAHRAGVPPSLAARVTLGRAAVSTRGNAIETAGWVRDNAIHSLIVVTAYYHMPRALAELSRAMPEVVLDPAPVMPPALHGLAAWRLLAEEYVKWLAVQAGLSTLVARS